ncbi:hypothetical protein [Janthinobacterium sp. ZB1P44]|uniref:hypothetical protein n=1 Tax=Janthinobacterium sp. ZB1P44 TaxID=3424192 RepID=UPI003F28480A
MQYDFNLPPNGGQVIDVKGRFVKYRSGNSSIRVRMSNGGYVDLLPGQGVWGVDYAGLTVQDRSGANNAGSIIAGDFDFRDDRITGTVDVVDGGKARVITGRAFSGAVAITPNAGQFGTLSLFNPAASPSRVMIEQLVISSNTSGEIGGYIGLSQVPNNQSVVSSPSSKLSGGADSACIFTRNTSVAANPYTGKAVFDNFLVAGQPYTYRLTEPIVLLPGHCLTIAHTVANGALILTAEHFEELIT